MMSQVSDENRTRRIFESDITDLAFDGKAVGEIGGKVTFFDAGLPGEKVRGEIVRKKARYNFARVTEIITRSPDRVPAPCTHFGICGGCTWQDLDYDRQLYFKRKQVVDCLLHIGRIGDIEVEPTVGSEKQFFYRNKMEFSLNTTAENGFVLGLHRRGHFDQIFNLKECLLQSETSNRIAAWFRSFVTEKNIPVYDILKHTGHLRFLAIREARRTGQIMLNIVTAEGTLPFQSEMLESAWQAVPEITTIVQNVNGGKSNIARGEYENILYGPGYIEEKLLDRTFRIYANSFFQTNTEQAERLYRTAYEILAPQKEDRLLDLYCGTGTIGLCASGLVQTVVGIELEPSAVRAAHENAALNDISNIQFHIGSVQDILRNNPELLDGITCTVIDPPRAGLHPKALRRLAELNYSRLVYISCNPATFARDAAYLIQAGYKIGRIIPVDMFPHTMHIELVAGFHK